MGRELSQCRGDGDENLLALSQDVLHGSFHKDHKLSMDVNVTHP